MFEQVYLVESNDTVHPRVGSVSQVQLGAPRLELEIFFERSCTAWKVSKYEVFSGPSFPTSGGEISLYSVRMRENTNQTNLRIWTLFTQCFP